MTKKNKHHYVPACYLSGFTKGGLRTSSFWCIPKNNKKPYGTNPNDSCVQRNYYKVNELHTDPLYVENWYGNQIETRIGSILKYIKSNKVLPKNEDMEILLILVATLYLRNPNHRNTISAPIEHSAKIIMSMISSSPDLYKNHAKKALEEGYINHIPEHYEIRKFFENDQFEINASKDYLIESEIKLIEPVMNYLAHRHWQLYLIPDDAEYEFITSDRPFILNLVNTENIDYFGLLTKNTIITIPINKKTVLIGCLEPVEECTFEANKIFTGEINSNITMKCNKVFYSSKEDILFSDGKDEYWYHNINNESSNK